MKENQDNFPSHLSTEQTEKLIANQERSLAVQVQELELKKQTDDHAYEFAKANLDANLQDRREQRTTYLSIVNRGLIFGGIIFGLVITLIITAMLTNQTQLASEIIKTIGYFGSGSFGGYYLGKSKAKNKSDED
jgi:hypothetical protein